jgi:pimeloyl-ACP methyl ester carboxylesterase
MLSGGNPPVSPALALEALPASLPRSLHALLARAVHPDPEQRFPSVRDFAEALAAIALDDFPGALPLAPEQRSAAPFAWCKQPQRIQTLGHDIMRADYRLADMGLDGEVLTAIRELSGFEDVGFAVFATASRLGPITDPRAFARATEVIVLMHGLYGSRETWRKLAAACCRANGQAIVIAPDLFGFGETRYAGGAPEARHTRPEALPRLVFALLSVLGLSGLPTVLAAHSAAATSILSVDDAEIPTHVHRVAVTPFYVHPSLVVRALMQLSFLIIRVLCWLPPTKRWLARLWAYNERTEPYTTDEKERMRRSFEAASSLHNYRLLSMYGARRPARGDHLPRTMIILVEDDPLVPAEEVTRTLRREGFPTDKIFRLGSGAHLPHSVEDFAARNINDIIAVIDTVLDSTRVGASTHVEPPRTITV